MALTQNVPQIRVAPITTPQPTYMSLFASPGLDTAFRFRLASRLAVGRSSSCRACQGKCGVIE
jgi:hypothetical protein